MADHIKELLAHIELKEEEIKKEQTQLTENISRLEEEKQEQSCLILELTKKTEDDLNTILELQQKFIKDTEPEKESRIPEHHCGAHWQSEDAAATSGNHLQNNQEQHAENLIIGALKGEESGFTQQRDNLKTASSFGCQHNNPDPLQRTSQNSLHVNSMIDQVTQLTDSIQSLKTKQEELAGNIHSLKEQQKEVTLSVQVRTEEKQQLTRTIWALKEEKDCISQSLTGLKQEKEQLGRAVCRLRDERDQFRRSMSGLKEEKEQLTKSLSALQRDKEAIIESLSRGKEERDQIKQSLHDLKAESDQLSQAVFHMKQQRDNLTSSLKCLAEQTDQQLINDNNQLMMSVTSLKEEKGINKHAVNLNRDEKQESQMIMGLGEDRTSLQTLPVQTQTQDRNHKEEMLNPDGGNETSKTAGDHAGPPCDTCSHRGRFIQVSTSHLFMPLHIFCQSSDTSCNMTLMTL